jgi:hypothetical protein
MGEGGGKEKAKESGIWGRKWKKREFEEAGEHRKRSKGRGRKK